MPGYGQCVHHTPTNSTAPSAGTDESRCTVDISPLALCSPFMSDPHGLSPENPPFFLHSTELLTQKQLSVHMVLPYSGQSPPGHSHSECRNGRNFSFAYICHVYALAGIHPVCVSAICSNESHWTFEIIAIRQTSVAWYSSLGRQKCSARAV